MKIPRPGQLPFKLKDGLKVLLISDALNNLTKRVQYKLQEHEVSLLFGYFRLSIVATGCPSEQHLQKTVNCYWGQCKDTRRNY